MSHAIFNQRLLSEVGASIVLAGNIQDRQENAENSTKERHASSIEGSSDGSINGRIALLNRREADYQYKERSDIRHLTSYLNKRVFLYPLTIETQSFFPGS